MLLLFICLTLCRLVGRLVTRAEVRRSVRPVPFLYVTVHDSRDFGSIVYTHSVHYGRICVYLLQPVWIQIRHGVIRRLYLLDLLYLLHDAAELRFQNSTEDTLFFVDDNLTNAFKNLKKN